MILMRNNKVATEDITQVEKAHRPDIGSIKGKTIWVKLIPTLSQLIEIPKELVNIN